MILTEEAARHRQEVPRPASLAGYAPPHRRRRRLWPWTLLVLFLAAAGAGAYWYGSVATAATGPRHVFATAQRGDIENNVAAVGLIEPRDYVDVGAQVSGQIEALHVALGDEVEKGALLAELDARVLKSQVAANQAQLRNLAAQLKERQAQHQLAREEHAREQGLMALNATSQSALDTAAANLRVAEAQIASTRAAIEQTQSNLDGDLANLGYTRIYAPMSGTVVTLDARLGQTLNANQTAPIILRIADLDTMTVKAQVSEADISSLRLGMAAHFTTLGEPDRRWSGTLRQILPTPEEVNGVILYNALFDVANTDRRLMTQMSAQVSFIVAAAQDVVTVPVSALRKTAGGGWEVQVADDLGNLAARKVEIGIRNRSQVEVAYGLAAGERVVVGVQSGDTQSGGMRLRGFF
ncbi:macrolide-specific efflux system membrane fusion protein [Dongia mobilis]|uniref:Macrolide-specific efflux system membrane fusion protein n=1 Tax=Dongia mobilis TaxID=578943 RepID=A0A4R6WQK8_9PROT|nr:efflux RND transporter periplasmic adaptor subunit [Dongia mobilis]TDQ83872.1 macrolide-specific efflux system membrane fusion protein [Dongia mobilis]